MVAKPGTPGQWRDCLRSGRFRQFTPPMKQVAILVYPGCMGSTALVLQDVLRMATQVAASLGTGNPEPLEPQLVSARPGPISLAGGLALLPKQAQRAPDLLLIPGLEVERTVDWDARLAALAPELRLIRRWFKAGVPLGTVCLGSFLAGEAGVLDDCSAATSWLFEADFAQRYPAVRLQRGAALCIEPRVASTGAYNSAFELAHHLIDHHHGARVAQATGRVLLVDRGRGSQRPYVDAQLLLHRPSPFAAQVQDWLRKRLTERYDLAAIAEAFHLSTRTLLRRYRQDTGSTPLDWLQRARVRRAQRLLEAGAGSLAQIVGEVGYEDVASFTRLFQRVVGESPARYRRMALNRSLALRS